MSLPYGIPPAPCPLPRLSVRRRRAYGVAPMTVPSAPLWAKGLPLDTAIHRFTVGEDPELDRALLPFDIRGSAAHARMLGEAGLLELGIRRGWWRR